MLGANENAHVDLSKYRSHVYMLIRRDELPVSAIKAKQLRSNTNAVHITYCLVLSVALKSRKTGEEKELPVN